MSGNAEIPPQVQNLFAQLQQLKAQMDALGRQKMQVEAMLRDAEDGREEGDLRPATEDPGTPRGARPEAIPAVTAAVARGLRRRYAAADELGIIRSPPKRGIT
jgi:hypothetical protein